MMNESTAINNPSISMNSQSPTYGAMYVLNIPNDSIKNKIIKFLYYYNETLSAGVTVAN